MPSATSAQEAAKPAVAETSTQKPDTTPAPAVAPITEAEHLKMQIAQLTKELVDANEAKAAIEKERDRFRLQLVLMQAAPVRADHEYDWSAGKLRRISDGMVWDANQNKHVADDKTPKPAAPAKPEDKPKAGGGMP